jgi:hypothetical protein
VSEAYMYYSIAPASTNLKSIDVQGRPISHCKINILSGTIQCRPITAARTAGR